MQHWTTDSGPHTFPIQWLPTRYPSDINGKRVHDWRAGKNFTVHPRNLLTHVKNGLLFRRRY